ncbi:response regulator [Salsuginibacillus kocurii]|uniref:response regulator n=1 Tax=Salsuginibacillus kocurii TaxID=427078 RepID=UPI00038234CA|nr:response regulator [Salsuginibacillus kocurii]
MIPVLIVEDDPMVAKFNRMYVEKMEGFEVTATASTISEAWEVVENEEVALVLLDIYMVEENGLQLLKEIRQKQVQVDVIVVSSANDKESIQLALHYGVVDYLMKPFDFERLQEAFLQYKEKQTLLEGPSAIHQEELDRFLQKKKTNREATPPLPKGLTKETFQRVIAQILNWESGWFSTADLENVTGISRVSLRKYLQYLQENDFLHKEVNYQNTGRPLQTYQLKAEQREVLAEWL